MKEEEKIRYSDLSFWLKTGIVGGVGFAGAFVVGFVVEMLVGV